MAKSAIDKIRDPKKKVKIVRDMPSGIAWAPPGSSMVVSTPGEVDSLMAEVAKGELTTSDKIRDKLAARHKADVACPMSTGIFINISGKAAAEMLEMGSDLSEVTPYWRTLKGDGSLNPKFPKGLDGHAERLEAEGFTIIKKSKNKWLVEGFEDFLV